MVSDEPVPLPLLAAALDSEPGAVESLLHALAAEYDDQGRGFELRRSDAGWRIYSRREHAAVVQRFVAEAVPAKLSRAALETLAIVAYRGPVTRATLSAIRGVSADAVLRTLLARGLVTEAGTEGPGGAAQFVATATLYEHLGLAGPDELPPLSPFLPDLEAVPDVPAPPVRSPEAVLPHQEEGTA